MIIRSIGKLLNAMDPTNLNESKCCWFNNTDTHEISGNESLTNQNEKIL